MKSTGEWRRCAFASEGLPQEKYNRRSGIMQSLLTDQVRLLALVTLCGLLWSLESIVPLYRYQNSRVRHALPNIALTLILVVTNLGLSFSSAYLAAFAVRSGVELFI